MFKIRPLKRTFILLFLLAVLLVILTQYQKNSAPENRVKRPQPAANLTANLPPKPPVKLTVALPDNYAFRQDDPRWGARKLGKTKDSLSEYGCTVTSVAMAVSNLLKTEISPAEMNTRLTKVDGYTSSGWLIWRHVGTATKGKLRAVMNTNPSHAAIKQCMQEGGYPIIKIDLDQRINHWVVIVGKSKDDYYIRDPRIGKTDDAPIPLSSRSDYIYATRCVSLNTD